MWWLALFGRAWGEDGAPPTPDEQIIVDEREAELRREAVIQRLRLLGYRVKAQHDGYLLLRASNATKSDRRWAPDVRLYDEGFVVLKKGSRRTAGGMKRREATVLAIETEMRAWRVAIQELALEHRLWEELPAELDAIWNDRTTAPHMRRAALLAYWTSRTCTPEGQAVRDAIRTYVIEEVQTSAWPVTDAEAQQASAENECGLVLELAR
jgi:hypothetical protein